MHVAIHLECFLFMAFESMNACIEHNGLARIYLFVGRLDGSAWDITNCLKWAQ